MTSVDPFQWDKRGMVLRMERTPGRGWQRRREHDSLRFEIDLPPQLMGLKDDPVALNLAINALARRYLEKSRVIPHPAMAS